MRKRGAIGIASMMLAAWTSARGHASAQDSTAAPEHERAVVVVVESARRGTRPEAVRSALSERLRGAPVIVLRDGGAAPRARVVVAVHRDGSADLHIVSQNGIESAAHLPAPSGDLSPAVAIAERIGELLGEAEDDPPTGITARHGLIPWEGENLRPYPDRSHRDLDSEPLLPWPQDETTGTPTRREAGAGLAAPPPDSGAQKR